MTMLNSLFSFLLLVVGAEANIVRVASEEQFNPNYADALDKSILFFEGQRSGRLPKSQRMKWRKHSALDDGHDVQLDLTGGYYDAGDNVKFNFPMAFSTTMLSWSVIEFVNSEKTKGLQLAQAQNAIRWATDYFLKCTRIPDKVIVQIGDPYSDHACWERPEDMDTNRTTYAVDKDHPGSEVSAEIAAALASASIVYRNSTHAPNYSNLLLERAIQVFNFADKYRGNYNDSLGSVVCPFYCDWSGYQDELVWAAAWLYKATKATVYWDYVVKNVGKLLLQEYESQKNAEFGWDDKHAGIFVLIANELLSSNASDTDIFRRLADKFVCTILPESPTLGVNYSKGGLIFKEGGSNMQRPAAISFLLVAYSRYLARANQVVQCGDKTATPDRLISIAKGQVDYILGNNPLKMSYMVGYGDKYPQKIHHRGSTLPSIDEHPEKLGCHDGTPYFESQNPNPNVLVGAVVGGPFPNDTYVDSRYLFKQSEPTTYINAPLVGVFAYLYSASDVI